jgi:hypothetical protein
MAEIKRNNCNNSDIEIIQEGSGSCGLRVKFPVRFGDLDLQKSIRQKRWLSPIMGQWVGNDCRTAKPTPDTLKSL